VGGRGCFGVSQCVRGLARAFGYTCMGTGPRVDDVHAPREREVEARPLVQDLQALQLALHDVTWSDWSVGGWVVVVPTSADGLG
jgi:hypothetical protein